MAWRIRVLFFRLFDYLIHIPSRFFRFAGWLFYIRPLRGKHKFLRWLTGVFLLMMDLTPVPFLIESFFDFLKWKTRPLNHHEKEIGTAIFGDNFPFHLLGVDPASVPARKKRTVAYVTFHTINFYDQIPDQTFIHEFVHVWQFRKYGSAYVSESLWAQKWGGGYNYGGFDALKKFSESPDLSAFNFEQQADIVEEYFRWKNTLPLQWAQPVEGIGDLLEKYRDELNA